MRPAQDRGPIVAVGLLTQADLAALGKDFRRHFAVEDLGTYDGLLRAIELADEAYHAHEQERYASERLKNQ